MIIDESIINSIQYYSYNDRRYNLQEYVKDISDRIGITPVDYGFPGTRNGGFKSCLSHFFDYDKNLNPIYRIVFRSKIINENVYIDIDAFKLMRRILELETLHYKGKLFEFFYCIHKGILHICDVNGVKPTSKFRNLMTKRYEKERYFPKVSAIQMAIELIIIKAKFKRKLELW